MPRLASSPFRKIIMPSTLSEEDFLAKRHEVEVQRDLCFGHAAVDHGRAPRLRPLLLDIYRPSTAGAEPRPAIVFAFGGAFHRGSKEDDVVQEDGHHNTAVAEYCREFARRGYVCFSIDYRLTPEDPAPGSTPLLLDPLQINRDRIDHVRGLMGLAPSTPAMVANAIEAAIDDMGTAIDWVHAHALELGVDPARIAAAGFSAGAVMALAATYGQKCPVAAVVSLSGAMGLAEMRSYIRDADAAPALLVHGENDLPGIGPINHALHLHMQHAGLDHACHGVPGGTHFYPRDSRLGDGRMLEDVLCEFLRTRVAGR
jgi:dienelactone hydrolase